MVYRPDRKDSSSKNEAEIEKKKSTEEMIKTAVTVAKNEAEIEKKKSTEEMIKTADTVAKNEAAIEKKKSTEEMIKTAVTVAKNEAAIEKKKSTKEMIKTAVTVAGAVVAVVGVVAWGAFILFSSSGSSDPEENLDPEENRERMKAPGRNGEVIFRDDFENDPKSYFRELRRKR